MKLLIFDLDGTLINSSQDIVNATNEFLALRKRPPLPPEIVISHIGEGIRKLVMGVLNVEDTDEIWDEVKNDFVRIYDKNLLINTRPYPGVVEFLKTSPYKMAIVSNKVEHLVKKTIQGLRLNEFNWVCTAGANTFSTRKPDPGPLFEVMKMANAQPHETVMIGDGIPDILAAQKAGVHCLAVSFGYSPIETLLSLGAKERLDDFKDLPHILKKMNSGRG